MKLFKKPIVEDQTIYCVTVNGKPDLNYRTRKEARLRKRSFANSLNKIHAEITVREFSGGYELPERVVT